MRELELPHIPFSFEFDPILSVDALLTMPDESRGEALTRATRLVPPSNRQDTSTYLDLGDEWALRDPPRLALETPLPCDIAHTVRLDFDEISESIDAGAVILSGQGEGATAAGTRYFPLGAIQGFAGTAIKRPGTYRMRAILSPDPDKAWAEPDVRSIWPRAIVTDWCEVRVVRK
jgi:hypothetical protein